MSGRKGNLASRSLEYRAPDTPKFLKALQAQVSSSSRYGSASHRDELDSLVASSSSSAGKGRPQDGDGDGIDSDDEIHGAQVVVLKEGKHISHDEAVRLKQQQQRDEPPAKEQPAQNIADATAVGVTKKRRLPVDLSNNDDTHKTIRTTSSSSAKPNPLDDVKRLIQQQRNPPPPPSPSPSTKDKPNKQKPKKVKPGKPGKGLSFNFDE
ncbi:hypothetical protein EX895_001611 [Sporisorium graminicola]|uniref:DUF4604 domain-containing protein n=1 Tax=Sporisorium graminicola TaxID=280036 RepID=A0A4U7KX25_9BASI|nr:hypothetical protein EX895_001611 [Sporisorium graminicola]TKY89080.1 hypothetical protein EX895_001611 [Sporisorium graminicola]